jgi:hypothetical protein
MSGMGSGVDMRVLPSKRGTLHPRHDRNDRARCDPNHTICTGTPSLAVMAGVAAHFP